MDQKSSEIFLRMTVRAYWTWHLVFCLCTIVNPPPKPLPLYIYLYSVQSVATCYPERAMHMNLDLDHSAPSYCGTVPPPIAAQCPLLLRHSAPSYCGTAPPCGTVLPPIAPSYCGTVPPPIAAQRPLLLANQILPSLKNPQIEYKQCALSCNNIAKQSQ